ncbi:MAG: hypothetical protein IPK03_11205 [Bacteroidetes bacterium]|nr:hypothetical protein [Bacteroidota bacterium]MBP7478622.1 hypothetical protein [Chitinophagales bacterium]
MLKYIPLVLFIYLTIPSVYSCKGKVKDAKPPRDTLFQEEIDSLMRIAERQTVTYKGIVANYGDREFNFLVDSGKLVSFDLETPSKNLNMLIFQEKSKKIEKDSNVTYIKGFEKIADTLFYEDVLTRTSNFKLILKLNETGIKEKEIAKFVLKIKK